MNEKSVGRKMSSLSSCTSSGSTCSCKSSQSSQWMANEWAQWGSIFNGWQYKAHGEGPNPHVGQIPSIHWSIRIPRVCVSLSLYIYIFIDMFQRFSQAAYYLLVDCIHFNATRFISLFQLQSVRWHLLTGGLHLLHRFHFNHIYIPNDVLPCDVINSIEQ